MTAGKATQRRVHKIRILTAMPGTDGIKC